MPGDEAELDRLRRQNGLLAAALRKSLDYVCEGMLEDLEGAAAEGEWCHDLAREARAALGLDADPGEPVDRSSKHSSHRTRFSFDASTFDEICEVCGATDEVPGGWGKLAYPCPGKRA